MAMVGAESSGLHRQTRSQSCVSRMVGNPTDNLHTRQMNWLYTMTTVLQTMVFISIITNTSITDYHFKYSLKSIDLLSLVH